MIPHVSRTVETHYGAVDADVLAELQQEFATSELLAALDTLGMVAARERRLRASLARLHAMASHELRGAPQTVTGEEPIWQLAQEIADELEGCITILAHIAKLVDRLGQLRPH